MAEGQQTPAPGSWKRELLEIMGVEMPITQLTPGVPTVQETDAIDFWDFPRFDVHLVQLDRKNPDEWFILAGSKVSVVSQVSLMKAISDMLDYKLENQSNFPGGGTVKGAGAPLVTLFFQEDRPDDAPDDWMRSKGEISFRLMDISETPIEGKTLITEQFVKTLAERIYNEFQKPNDEEGFIWEKGKNQYNYTDWNEGYGLKILHEASGSGKQHAEEIIKKILRIRGHRFAESKATVSIPENPTTYRNGRRTITVLGEEVKMPRYRPEVKVRFRKATLELQLRGKRIPLVVRGALGSSFVQ